MLSKNCKILVAGHRKLMSSAIWDNLKASDYNNFIGVMFQTACLIEEIV